MIRTEELKRIIARNGKTQSEVARAIGMKERTFYAKMKRGVFGSDEIMGMITLLKMENPAGVFFPGKGAADGE